MDGGDGWMEGIDGWMEGVDGGIEGMDGWMDGGMERWISPGHPPCTHWVVRCSSTLLPAPCTCWPSQWPSPGSAWAPYMMPRSWVEFPPQAGYSSMKRPTDG